MTDGTNKLSEAAILKPLSSNSNEIGFSEDVEVQEPLSGEESSDLRVPRAQE